MMIGFWYQRTRVQSAWPKGSSFYLLRVPGYVRLFLSSNLTERQSRRDSERSFVPFLIVHTYTNLLNLSSFSGIQRNIDYVGHLITWFYFFCIFRHCRRWYLLYAHSRSIPLSFLFLHLNFRALDSSVVFVALQRDRVKHVDPLSLAILYLL